MILIIYILKYSGFLDNAEKCIICGHIIIDMVNSLSQRCIAVKIVLT